MIYSSRKHEEESTAGSSLSARLRPNSECAPWILDEIIKLEDKIRTMAAERSGFEVAEMNRRLDAIGRAIGLEPQKLAEDPDYARQALKDAYRRGAEAMREACARMEPYAYNLDDHLMISKWRSLVRGLPIPEDK